MRTPESEALTNLIVEIFRLNGALLLEGNRLAEPFGLSSARWQVLGAIELAGRPLTVAQIARRMGLTRQGVRRVVNDLEELGMVVFSPNPDHRRAPLVSLTAGGAESLAGTDRAQSRWANALAEGLTERQVTRALELLRTVRERLERPPS